MSDNVKLAVGDPAPPLALPDSTGATVSLTDFRGKTTIVYFYPAANTPGCTKQACDFRDNLTLLNDAGYQVLGVSPDSPEKLTRFTESKHLTFPLLSDQEKTTMINWGAYGKKNSYGRIVSGVIRSTFVIDPEGIITTAAYNVRATGHVAKLIKDLKIGS